MSQKKITASPTSTKREHGQFAHLYRTNRWRKLSEAHRRKEPLCRMCKADGNYIEGKACDHINGHPKDETEEQFWAGPFQTLCAEHHSGAKQMMDRSGVEVGCNADGVPNHRKDWA